MTVRPALYRARWVLPVTAPAVRDGAVLVDDAGRIAGVGAAAAIATPDGIDVHDLGEAVLLPGLVNTHMHLELSVLRGLLDDLTFTEWIPALLAIKRDAALTEEDYAVAARWSLIEAVAAGITTIGATEDSAAGLHALLASGQRGVVYREVFGPAPEQCEESIARLERQLAQMGDAATDRVRVGVSPHAPYTVSEPLFRAVARLALDRGLPLAIHAAESRAESEFVTAGTGVFADRLRRRGIEVVPRAKSTIAWLDALGLLEARPLLIHCVHVDDGDIARIADTGSAVAHCPIANARLGHGVAPLAALLDAGVTTGLGTDSVASNNRVDVLEEARTAQLFQRVRAGDAAALPSERLLRLATLDGARALGLDGRTGSLDVGKDADLCAVSLAAPHTRPVHDPLAALFHAARGSDVLLTVVGGRVLYRNGRCLAVDTDRAGAAIDALATRVAGIRHGTGPA